MPANIPVNSVQREILETILSNGNFLDVLRAASGLIGNAGPDVLSTLPRIGNGVSRDIPEGEELLVMSLEMHPRFFILSGDSETSSTLRCNRSASGGSNFEATPCQSTSNAPSSGTPNSMDECSDPILTNSSIIPGINNERKLRKKTKAEKSKEANNLGLAHLNRSGKYIPAASLKPPCDCQKKCRLRFPEEERRVVHKKYWELGDKRLQWEFVVRHSSNKEVTKRTRGDGSRRNFSRQYFFETKGAKTRIFICKTMFMNTLDISSNVIQSAYNHLSNGTVTPCQQEREESKQDCPEAGETVKRLAHNGNYLKIIVHQQGTREVKKKHIAWITPIEQQKTSVVCKPKRRDRRENDIIVDYTFDFTLPKSSNTYDFLLKINFCVTD